MAVRKSWLQHLLIRSSVVVARFFVALHESDTINAELVKEAQFFSDIIIVPFLDNYSLVVLKTIAICEFREWPEEYYLPYSDGAGYILSSDIAQFIISEFKKGKLRREDVSMGMWVQQFSNTRPVEYLHDSRFSEEGPKNVAES
ncbi:hypothetical protein Droror1_Dr00020082 [Drosera rotundifolia]